MDYMPSVMKQTVSLVYSAGLGFCFGLVYYLFRIIFYSLTGSDKKLSTVRDIIYVLVCLCAHFLFALVMCSGRVLMFIFVGEGAGLAVYFAVLSGQFYIPLKSVISKMRCLIKRLCTEISGILHNFTVLLKKQKIILKFPKFFQKKT